MEREEIGWDEGGRATVEEEGEGRKDVEARCHGG